MYPGIIDDGTTPEPGVGKRFINYGKERPATSRLPLPSSVAMARSVTPGHRRTRTLAANHVNRRRLAPQGRQGPQAMHGPLQSIPDNDRPLSNRKLIYTLKRLSLAQRRAH